MKKLVVLAVALTFADVANAELYCTNGKGHEVVWSVGAPRPVIDLTLGGFFYCDAGGAAYARIAAMPGVRTVPGHFRGGWFGDEARFIVWNVAQPAHADYQSLR